MISTSKTVTPGDEILWSILLSSRPGMTMPDPTIEEMVEVFGERWRVARHVCRVWASASQEQKLEFKRWSNRGSQELDDIRWVAARSWGSRSGWHFTCPPESMLPVWDVLLAVCASPPEEGWAWDHAAYMTLAEPWLRVFGYLPHAHETWHPVMAAI